MMNNFRRILDIKKIIDTDRVKINFENILNFDYFHILQVRNWIDIYNEVPFTILGKGCYLLFCSDSEHTIQKLKLKIDIEILNQCSLSIPKMTDVYLLNIGNEP